VIESLDRCMEAFSQRIEQSPVRIIDQKVFSRRIEQEISLYQKQTVSQVVDVQWIVKHTLKPESRMSRKAYALH
jgi:hypothetical protein